MIYEIYGIISHIMLYSIMKNFSPIFSKNNFEDVTVMRKLNSIFIKKRGYDFKMPAPGTPVLLLVSGGLDSIMLWFNLLNTYKLKVYPIHLSGNHSLLGEKYSLAFFYAFFKKKFPHLVNTISYIKPYSNNFNLRKKNNRKILNNNQDILINNLFINNITGKKNVFFVNYPVRFAYYMLAAYEYGLVLQSQGISINTLFTGTVPDDGKTTRESTLTVLRSLNVYLCCIFGDWKWQITSPLEKSHKFYYPKAKAIKIANINNVPIEKTWSCGMNYFVQCGICKSCLCRQSAFKDAHIIDKTIYLTTFPPILLLKNAVAKLRKFMRERLRLKHPSIKAKDWPNASLCLSPEVIEHKDGKKIYLINKKTSETLCINATAKEILQILNKKRSANTLEIILKLQKRFPHVVKERLSADGILFIEELINKGFILLSNP